MVKILLRIVFIWVANYLVIGVAICQIENKICKYVIPFAKDTDIQVLTRDVLHFCNDKNLSACLYEKNQFVSDTIFHDAINLHCCTFKLLFINLNCAKDLVDVQYNIILEYFTNRLVLNAYCYFDSKGLDMKMNTSCRKEIASLREEVILPFKNDLNKYLIDKGYYKL